MAEVEERIIRIIGDSSQLRPTIKELRSLGIITEKNEKQFTKAHNKMQRELEQTGRKAQALGTKSKAGAAVAGTAFSGLQTRVLGLGTAMIGAFAIQQIVTQAIGNIKKFETSLDNLQAITGATTETMEFLTAKALEIGATSTKSAIEAVEAFKLMASAKPELLENAEALAEVTQQAILLSEASGQTLPEAIRNLGDTLNAMDLPASDAARVVNVLAAASQKGAREVPFLTAALSKFGGVAASAGVSIETSAAAIEILGAKIPQAETVGVGLRNVLLELQTAAQAQGREFKGLGEELDLLAPRINDITFLEKSFGKENILVAQTLIKQRDELRNMTDAITGTNTAMEQAVTNTDNLEGSLARAANAWQNFTLSLSESKGVMQDAVDGFTTLLVAMSDQGDELERLIDLQGGPFVQSVQDVFEAYGDFGRRLEALKDLQADNITQLERQVAIQTILIEKLKENEAADEELFDAEIKLAEATIALEEARTELTESTAPLIRSSEELDAIFNKTKDTVDDTSLSFKELQKNVQNALLVIKDQAAEGQISAAAITLYENAVNALESAQKEVDEAIGKASKTMKTALTPIGLLRTKIADLKTEMLNQALAGDISTDTMREYKNATRELTLAQIDLEVAMMNTLEPMKAQKLELMEINEVAMVAFDDTTKMEAWFDTYREAISSAIGAEQTFFRVVQQLNDNKLQAIENERTVEQRNLDERLEKKTITEEEFAKRQGEIDKKANEERKKILRDQFLADQAAAAIQAGINTAVAVTKALETSIPLAIIVAGLGALEIAAILAAPTPEFHKGEIDIQSPNDEFHAKLKRGESVIRPEATAMYKDELQAANDFKLKEFILKKYVIPALNADGGSGDGAFGGTSLNLHTLEKRMKIGNQLSAHTNQLLTELQDNYNPRRSWRN